MPEADQSLIQALRSAQLEIVIQRSNGLPEQLPELQSYDTIILSNVAAGDAGNAQLPIASVPFAISELALSASEEINPLLPEVIRGTPLEESLPVDMELTSQSATQWCLGDGDARMEFNNGNQIARQLPRV